MQNELIFEKEGPIAWLKFNEPDRLNALTEDMGDALKKIVPEINKDKSLRVAILTGEGRAFSAGGNLDIIVARTQKKKAVNQKEMLSFYTRFLSILNVEVPLIAMIQGPAIGAAFCLTLACDLRIASTSARMGVNFVKIGLSPGMGSTFLLPEVLGVPNALDLLLTGRTLTAEEALSRGIIHHLYAPENLVEETKKIANDIAANAPLAVRIAKRGIRARQVAVLRSALLFESKGQADCFKTKDIVEGITAIRAKRLPEFSGS